MSPEWMMALDGVAARNAARRKTLADPLQRPEWQGLDFLSLFVARLLSGRKTGGRHRRGYETMRPLAPARIHQ